MARSFFAHMLLVAAAAALSPALAQPVGSEGSPSAAGGSAAAAPSTGGGTRGDSAGTADGASRSRRKQPPSTAPAPDATAADATAAGPSAGKPGRARWRSPGSSTATSSGEAADLSAGGTPSNLPDSGDGRVLDVKDRPRRSAARVTQAPPTLPNEAGQVWREYDLSDYTLRVSNTARPEQAIVDWILRETGYEAWHGEPLGILSAGPRKLIVYHTPEMQAIVADVVDRFVNREAETHAFSLRVVSVGNPNWRARAQGVMQPVEVKTQGIQAWLMQREDAALLLAELRKRTDFREHSAPHLLVANGQSAVVTQTRPRTYIQHVVPRPEVWPGYEVQQAQFDEGFSLELSPLLSLDGRTIDAVIHCQIDQLERLVPVMLDVPTPLSPRQRTKIEVPQVTHCRLHERFRWPTNQVLVVGLGVVANPVAPDSGRLLPQLPLVSGPERADLLVFVESKGRLDRQASAGR